MFAFSLPSFPAFPHAHSFYGVKRATAAPEEAVIGRSTGKFGSKKDFRAGKREEQKKRAFRTTKSTFCSVKNVNRMGRQTAEELKKLLVDLTDYAFPGPRN